MINEFLLVIVNETGKVILNLFSTKAHLFTTTTAFMTGTISSNKQKNFAYLI